MALDFYCQCLNVRIHVSEGSILDSLENSVEDAIAADPFFSNVLLISAPHGVEIDKNMQCLLHDREIEHWKINSCLNCGIETHAFSSKDDDKFDKIFVSAAMEKDLQAVNLISTSKRFSPIYKVLIQKQSLESLQSFLPLLPRDQLHHQLEELKARTIQLLNAENEFVLERIRKFENEQMSNFNELQTRTLHDQNILTQLLINNYKECAVDSGQNNVESSTTEIKKNAFMPAAAISPGKPPHLSPTKSLLASMTSIPSDDTIFAMDEEEMVESSDVAEDDSEAEDRVSDDEAFASHADSCKMYAASLPISMPGIWQAAQRSQEQDILGGGERGKMDDPHWIAASIQALAMSVRGNDGTEMFGARPRPRLNTLD